MKGSDTMRNVFPSACPPHGGGRQSPENGQTPTRARGHMLEQHGWGGLRGWRSEQQKGVVWQEGPGQAGHLSSPLQSPLCSSVLGSAYVHIPHVHPALGHLPACLGVEAHHSFWWLSFISQGDSGLGRPTGLLVGMRGS